MKKTLVIVGGVAGGASCAARARRLSEEAEIILLERGEYVSFANCGLPYHIGGDIPERSALIVQTPEALKRTFRIDVRTRSEAIAIHREEKEVEVLEHSTGRQYRLRYDALVLSPGAEPIRPPLLGIGLPGVFTLRDIPGMDAIIKWVSENGENSEKNAAKVRQAVVVGGGFIGLEMAESLRHRGIEVALVEKLPQVMPAALDPEMAALVHKELCENGVILHLGAGLAGIEASGEPGKSESLNVRLDNGAALPCQMVILAIGVRPSTELGKAAGLKIGPRGGFAVDEFMRTNDPAIYAVGDAAETLNLLTGEPILCALAGPANRQGRLVADHIFGHATSYRGSQGTAIVKVFNLAAANTGLTRAACRRAGIASQAVFITARSHASYYPGSNPVHLKVIFSEPEGKILGAQAIGKDGVDKRIDVMATAIRAGMTVFDLEHLELAYAPPFGSARDPVNIAGFAAANHLRGDAPLAHWDEIESLNPLRQAILDVRTLKERQAGAVPGSLHIPLDSIRECMDQLPRDRELLVHCAAGLRSYLAVRILRQNGFNARNLSGGFQLYLQRKS